jgi:Peptidase inhibitor I78 family
MGMMRMRIRLAATGLALVAAAGCTTASTQGPQEPVLSPPDATSCNAVPAQSFVGQRADQASGAAILKASGARTLRWGPPNSAWTMDFREDRVSVQYDERMIIQRITCG